MAENQQLLLCKDDWMLGSQPVWRSHVQSYNNVMWNEKMKIQFLLKDREFNEFGQSQFYCCAITWSVCETNNWSVHI